MIVRRKAAHHTKEFFMKKNFKKLFGIIAVATVVGLLAGCASKPGKVLPSLPSNVVAGPGETEVVVQYRSNALAQLTEILDVYIDAQLVAQAVPESTERIIVKNGSRSIVVRESGKRGLDTPLQFNANGDTIIFNVVKVLGMLGISDQTPGKAN